MTTGKALNGKPYAENPLCKASSARAFMAAVVAIGMMTPALAGTAVWKSNAGGDITEPTNWVGDAVPKAGDTLDFSAITSTGYTLTGLFGDDRIFTGAKFALTGVNYVTLAGSLHFQSLSNANHLAIASTGSLTVENNLTWQASSANNYNNVGELLYKNDGTVVVKGVAYEQSGNSKSSGVHSYQTREASSAPLRVGGIEYQGGGYAFGYRLPSNGSEASWIVGSQGMFFYGANSNPSSNGETKSCFVVDGANATLHSQADWSIETSGNQYSVADINIDGQTLTIDTKDYDNNSVSRTVTLNGRIYAPSKSGTSLSITGNGTFEVATSVTSGKLKYTCISNTVEVADTATLQLDEGASYQIANVSLAAGTTLALPSSSADSFATRTGLGAVTLPSSGTVNLVVDGPLLAKGSHKLLSCVPFNYTRFSVSGTAIGGRNATLSDDGDALYMTIGVTAVWKSNAGGDITEPTNWVGDAVPEAGDTLDFSAITSDGFELTGTFSDDRIFAGATFALSGNNNVRLSGSLHFQNLSDANHLRIYSGGSLVVEGDLKWALGTAINESADIGRLLQQNDGTVVVKGLAWAFGGYSNQRGCCYQTRGASGTPLRVGGIQYQSGGYRFWFYLHCYGNTSASGPGQWIVGSNGMTFYPGGSGGDAKNCFIVGGGNKDGSGTTLYSQADWAIGTSGNSKSIADIYIDGKTLTIDTKDYDDNTVPRTVTLNGRIYAPSTSGTALSITGNGTFEVATAVTSGTLKYTCISNTVAVADTATLQLDESASYQIANVSLSAGTTLALPASTTTPVERTLPSLTLPADGTAAIRIDGPALGYGEYDLLSSVPEGYREHLSVEGSALGGKKGRLAAVGGKLKLRISKAGLLIVVH